MTLDNDPIGLLEALIELEDPHSRAVYIWVAGPAPYTRLHYYRSLTTEERAKLDAHWLREFGTGYSVYFEVDAAGNIARLGDSRNGPDMDLIQQDPERRSRLVWHDSLPQALAERSD